MARTRASERAKCSSTQYYRVGYRRRCPKKWNCKRKSWRVGGGCVSRPGYGTPYVRKYPGLTRSEIAKAVYAARRGIAVGNGYSSTVYGVAG